MDILFTGTGASEWAPENRFKSNYRRKSSLLIDGTLMIDAGPDIFTFEKDFSYNRLYSGVKAILQTHSHRDHLSEDSLRELVKENSKCMILGDTVTLESIKNIDGLQKIATEPYLTSDICGYAVTPLKSNHTLGLVNEQPLHYIIEKNGKRIFYGCDGAWLLYPTWAHMKKLSFDLMILDGTTGELDGNIRNFEHNNLAMVRLLATTFRENNLLTNKGKIMISHMAMSLHGSHKDLEDRLGANEVQPAFDGMQIKV